MDTSAQTATPPAKKRAFALTPTLDRHRKKRIPSKVTPMDESPTKRVQERAELARLISDFVTLDVGKKLPPA